MTISPLIADATSLASPYVYQRNVDGQRVAVSGEYLASKNWIIVYGAHDTGDIFAVEITVGHVGRRQKADRLAGTTPSTDSKPRIRRAALPRVSALRTPASSMMPRIVMSRVPKSALSDRLSIRTGSSEGSMFSGSVSTSILIIRAASATVISNIVMMIDLGRPIARLRNDLWIECI